MWKVDGTKIEPTWARYISLVCKQVFFFGKTLRIRNFFGAATHRILTHSGFRKCMWKVGTISFVPCFGLPKLGECDKMRCVSKIMRCQKKCISHNFQIWAPNLNHFLPLSMARSDLSLQASKLKSLLAIVYGKKWFKFASSILKILGDTFFWHRNFHFVFFK